MRRVAIQSDHFQTLRTAVTGTDGGILNKPFDLIFCLAGNHCPLVASRNDILPGHGRSLRLGFEKLELAEEYGTRSITHMEVEAAKAR
jgi:hypothetical protein